MVTTAAAADPARTRSAKTSAWLGPGGHGDRPLLFVGSIGLALLFVIRTVGIVTSDHRRLVQLMPDDSFYYLEIARHIARGDGFTFDGVHRTNGFHVIWQLLLVIPARFVSDPDALVKVGLFLGLVITFVAVFLFARIAARVMGWGAALVAALIALHVETNLAKVNNGMEGPVVVLALALLATVLLRFIDAPSAGRAMWVGALCVVCALARFDLGAVVWIAPVAMAWRTRKPRYLGWWLVGSLIVGIPFAVWWLPMWDFHLLTTSATVKTHVVSILMNRYGGAFSTGFTGFIVDYLTDYVREMLAATASTPIAALSMLARLVIVGFGVFGVWTRFSRGPRRLREAEWAIAVVMIMILVKVFLDTYDDPVWAVDWYASPQRVLIPFVLALFALAGCARLAEQHRELGIIALVAVACVGIPTDISNGIVHDNTRPGGYWQEAVDETADWLLANGPPGNYSAYDTGLLQYRLDGRNTVVNIDGLVNDYAFAKMVVDDTPLSERFRVDQVDYLVNRVTPDMRAGELACAKEVFRSQQPAFYGDPIEGTTKANIYVLDVRPCWK